MLSLRSMRGYKEVIFNVFDDIVIL